MCHQAVYTFHLRILHMQMFSTDFLYIIKCVHTVLFIIVLTRCSLHTLLVFYCLLCLQLQQCKFPPLLGTNKALFYLINFGDLICVLGSVAMKRTFPHLVL